MGLKKPEQLEVGMILGGDVYNLHGQVLFKKGIELTERSIDILQQWGIPKVDIEGEEQNGNDIDLHQFPPKLLERADRLVSERFKLTKSSHPVVEYIHRVCLRKQAVELQRQTERP